VDAAAAAMEAAGVLKLPVMGLTREASDPSPHDTCMYKVSGEQSNC
jgi:hypothetical protein